MGNTTLRFTHLPADQQAIRAKCLHPTGKFLEFPKEEVEQSITDRFEKIVGIYPDRMAVKGKDRLLTYDELNRAANQLAHAIVAQRGQEQEPLGLFLKDGVRLIIAHLAVLKSGKFSFVLDPAAPEARTAHLLDDSRAALTVAENETEPMAREWTKHQKQMINMDESNSVLNQENLELTVPPDAYSYLRYTSGSTGKAKGGLKTHRHVLHAVMNATNYFHICADDRSTLLTPASFLG
jgi:non-ribosomal peptide synthetase component F